ncbi:MAG: sugar ABC transporter permease [Anaerolineae bacterium]|nr:sugar ABC transporter permease [Anaerolineae bacterium]
MARMSRMARRNERNGILFVSPWLIGFAVFIAYPLLASLRNSFTNLTMLKAPRFVGLANYYELLFRDELFKISLFNTLYYVALAVPLGTIFSLAFAVLLNQKLPGISLFRTIYYLPTIVPAVASAIIWVMLLNPQFGIVNSIIRAVGLRAPGWLGDPNWSKPALVMMSLWGTGSTIIIYLAALQDVPEHLVEAAVLDGANAWDRFVNVTVPMISPAMLFNVIMGLIGGFQYFTQAYVMTQGGPLHSTLFYALYLYRNAFQYLKMGYACAMAWLLFLITLACTVIVMRTSARVVYYGGE